VTAEKSSTSSTNENPLSQEASPAPTEFTTRGYRYTSGWHVKAGDLQERCTSTVPRFRPGHPSPVKDHRQGSSHGLGTRLSGLSAAAVPPDPVPAPPALRPVQSPGAASERGPSKTSNNNGIRYPETTGQLFRLTFDLHDLCRHARYKTSRRSARGVPPARHRASTSISPPRSNGRSCSRIFTKDFGIRRLHAGLGPWSGSPTLYILHSTRPTFISSSMRPATRTPTRDS